MPCGPAHLDSSAIRLPGDRAELLGRFRCRGSRPARLSALSASPAVADGDPAELALPVLDARTLARRAALPVLVAVAVVGGVILSGAPLQAFADALGRALDADPRWVVAAAIFELLSFAGYVALLWLVAERASRRLGLRASAQVTLGGAAATRLLPAGGLGGVAMTIWALRRAGLGAGDATRTLLAFLVVLYSVFFAAIAAAGGSLSLGLSSAGGPLSLSAIPAAVAGGIILGGLLLARQPPAGPAAGGRTDAAPRRALSGASRAPASLGAAIRDALELIRGGDPRLLGALAWWAFDAAVLWAMLQALGTPPALAVVVLAYFVGQIANTLPLPGAVSGGMVGVLIAFGVQIDLAIASVFAYRAVAIWLPTPIGVAALRGLRRTVADWAREDATADRLPAGAPLSVHPPEPARPALQAAA